MRINSHYKDQMIITIATLFPLETEWTWTNTVNTPRILLKIQEKEVIKNLTRHMTNKKHKCIIDFIL